MDANTPKSRKLLHFASQSNINNKTAAATTRTTTAATQSTPTATITAATASITNSTTAFAGATKSKAMPSLSNTKRLFAASQHETMLQQAFYNTGANVIVVLAGLGVVGLYWVLESFFRPLMWAMLCGAFLYPFKNKVTKFIKNWLRGLKESGTPLALGIFKIPIDILNISSENVIESLHQRWKVIAVVTGVFLTLYVTYHHVPMDFKQFSGFTWHIYLAVSNFICYFSFKWVSLLY